jgi:hypothetical protein
MLSRPVWLVGGLLIGVWLAYALVRLAGKPRNLTKTEAAVAVTVLVGLVAFLAEIHPDLQGLVLGLLRFDEVLFFLIAAVMVRVAVIVASITNARGRLLLCFGLPVGCAGLGDLYGTVASGPGSPNQYVLAAQSGTWLLLGALIGLWFAYAVARVLADPSQLSISPSEVAVVTLVFLVIVFWALFGSQAFNGQWTEGEPDFQGAVFPLFVVIGATWAVRGAVSLLPRSQSRPHRLGVQARRRIAKAWIASLAITGIAGILAVPAAQEATEQCLRQPACDLGGPGVAALMPRLGLQVSVDGRMATASQLLPVFVGSRVLISLDMTVPAGAAVTCVSVAPNLGWADSRCGLGERTGVFSVTHRLGPGGHAFRMTWRVGSFVNDSPQQLGINWQETTKAATGFVRAQTALASFSVVPAPTRGASPASLPRTSPEAPECGMRPAGIVPSTILLDCGSGLVYATHLRWSQWGGSRAVGRGLVFADACLLSPKSHDCASAAFNRQDGTIVLYGLSTVDGRSQYTLATATYRIVWSLHDTVQSFRLLTNSQ